MSLKLKQEWLIHVRRTKQSAQTKTLSAFLISVFWLSLVIDTKSSPALKLHEIVRPKKLNISPGRGTENNQTERYGKEVSRVSPSSEDRNEGLWGGSVTSQSPSSSCVCNPSMTRLLKILECSAQGGHRRIIGA